MWVFDKTIEGETILVNLDTGEILTNVDLVEDKTTGIVTIKKWRSLNNNDSIRTTNYGNNNETVKRNE